MAKRRTSVKLSKTQMLDNEVNRWAAKFEAAVDMLMRSRLRLADARRKQQRNAKKLLAEKEAKRAARATVKSEAVEPTKPEQEPVRAIPLSEAHPHSKVAKEKRRKGKAGAVAEAAGELAQSDLPRLSAMFPFGKQAKLSEADREKAVQLAEQKRDRMRQMGFRPIKR